MRSSSPKESRTFLFYIFVLWLFIYVSLPCSSAFADKALSLKAYPKSNWGEEDIYVTGYPPNVLLLIDTGSPMLWTPKGKMPSEKVSYYDTPLVDCTYGDGSRPSSWFNARNERYGIDRDGSNNDIYDDNCYYNDLIFKDPSYTRDNPKPGYSVNDLIPNDSRLYKMKLVLWRILESPELIEELNLGLATFWQENVRTPLPADWYKVYPYKGGPDWAIEDYRYHNCYRDSQKISWGVNIDDYKYGSKKANKARLRVPIQSTSDSDVVDQIKKLIDGEESWENDELRADGKAPLARSIYSDKVSRRDKDSSGTAWHFFDNTHMGGVCQTNWLVVMTAGDDNIGGESPVDSVKKLYQKSKRLNGQDLNYPIRTLVIGFVDPDDDSPDVVKLRDTLNQMAFYGMDSGYESDGTPREYVAPSEGESYAFFANDVPGLIQGFSRVFATIQSGRFGSNAPIAVRSPGAEGDISAYTPFYTRKVEGQWWGDLRKEDLDTGRTLWSAEEELPSPGSRNIYTVNWDDSDGVPDLGVGNLCVFKPETSVRKRSVFSEEMGFGKNNKKNLNDLIGWLRGYESYKNGDISKRDHVLSDMEHSSLCLVGAPSDSYIDPDYVKFKKKWGKRASSVYIQSNSGMLHAFDSETGEERWAFVPPNALCRYRIASLRFVMSSSGSSDNYKVSSYSSDEGSNSLYLLDGPMAVGDVRLPSGDYATVLIGFLGRGGAGMYALDITDPDSPSFLWAIENVFDVNNSSEKKLYWTKKEGTTSLGADLQVLAKNDSPNFNYLGFTVTGAPSLGKMTLGGKEKFVFVLSGGVGTGKDGSIGKAVYVVDVLTGEILHTFYEALDEDGKNEEVGSVLSPAVPYSTRMINRSIEGFFSSDSHGGLLHGEKEDDSLTLKRIWSLSCPSVRDGVSFSALVNPFPLAIGLIDSDVWVFGGTSSFSLLEVSEDRKGFFNEIDIIYSLNVDKIEKDSSFKDFGNAGVGLVGLDDESQSDDPLGWFIPLAQESSRKGQEYSTTAPLMSHGAIFIATYRKDLKEDPCIVNGFANLYALDPRTGRGLFGGGRKYLTFEGLKIAGLTVLDDKLLISVKKMKMEPFSKPEGAEDIDIVEKGDLIQIDLNDLDLPEGVIGSRKPKAIYWREIFLQ